MKKRLKINGFIIFLNVVALAVFPKVFLRQLPKEDIWNQIAEIMGICFILAGQIIRVSARGFKSEQSNNGRDLVQGGPYSLVRNPMYLGILLIGIGVVLMLFNWWVVGIFTSVFVIRYAMLTFNEEAKLRALFSDRYKDYCNRVPRLIPLPTRIFSKDIAEYLPIKLAWFYREIGSIATLLFVVLFIKSWKDLGIEGLAVILVVIVIFVLLVLWLDKRTPKVKNP